MKTKKLKLRLVGRIYGTNSRDILKELPAEVLEELREKEEHPVLAVFNIGSEGESKGDLEFNTSEDVPWYIQLWDKRGIQSLISRVKESFGKVWLGHSKIVNDKRKTVGVLVHAFGRIIDGVLNAFAVAHITDKETEEQLNNGELDICSIEARCLFEESDDRSLWNVIRVTAFNGLALASSSDGSPGFETASVVGVIAALEKEEDEDEDNSKRKQKGRFTAMENVSILEVKEYIRVNGWKPDQLFPVEEVIKSEVVRGAIKSSVDEETAKLKTQIDDLEKEMVPYKKQSQVARIGKLLEESSLVKDIEKDTVDYLKRIVRVDAEDLDDNALRVAVDTEIKEQLLTIKDMGIQIGKSNGDKGKSEEGSEEDKNQESGKSDNSSQEEGGDSDNSLDYTDPKNNDLIPQPAESGKK